MEHDELKNILSQAWGIEKVDQAMVNAWSKLKQHKFQLRDVNRYMTSYSQKLNITREKIDIIQRKIQGQLIYPLLIEKEKQLLM